MFILENLEAAKKTDLGPLGFKCFDHFWAIPETSREFVGIGESEGRHGVGLAEKRKHIPPIPWALR